MTQPIAQGFADWQRNAPSSNVLFCDHEGIVDTGTVYGPFWSGYTDSIGLVLKSQVKLADFSIQFYSDSAASQLLASDEIVVADGGFFNGAIRTKGPFFTITTVIPVGPATLNIRAYGLPLSGLDLFSVASCLLIMQDQKSIGAGVTATYTSLQTYPGPAYVQVYQNTGAWSAILSYIDGSGNSHVFQRWNSTFVQEYNGIIHLPAAPLILQVTNNAAGAVSHTAIITGRARP